MTVTKYDRRREQVTAVTDRDVRIVDDADHFIRQRLVLRRLTVTSRRLLAVCLIRSVHLSTTAAGPVCAVGPVSAVVLDNST